MVNQHEDVSRRRFLHGIVLAVSGVIGSLLGLPILSYFLSPDLKGNKVYAQVDQVVRPKWPVSTPRPISTQRTSFPF